MQLLNPVNYRDFVKTAGSKVQRAQGGKASVGFTGLELLTDAGAIPVHSDPACPVNKAFVIQTSTWQIVSYGQPISFLGKPGEELRTVDGSDAVQSRLGGYMKLVCSAPGWNATILLA